MNFRPSLALQQGFEVYIFQRTQKELNRKKQGFFNALKVIYIPIVWLCGTLQYIIYILQTRCTLTIDTKKHKFHRILIEIVVFEKIRRIDISRRGEVSNSFLTRKLELRKSSRLRNAKRTTYKIKEKAALSLRRHLQ